MTTRLPRWALGAIALVGLVPRLVWIRMANHRPIGLFDPARYLGYAEAIADGRGMIEWTGHPTAYYPPGYPLFAGLVTWVSRITPWQPWTTILLVQAVIGAATCVVGALVAERLAGRWAGLAAGLLLAVYPNLVFHSGAILGETLFNGLFLAFLLVFLRWSDDPGRGRGVLVAAGVLLGAAVLVRPISLAVLPIVALALWTRERDLRVALRTTGIVTLVVAACIVPWTIRNAIRMNAFVPISTNTGENLCIGNHPDADGAFTLSDHCDFGNILESSSAEAEIDGRKTRYALGRIVAEPGRQPRLVWRRFWFTWIHSGDHDGIVAAQSYNTDPWMDPVTRDRLVRAADAAYVVVAVAGLVGTAVLLRRRRPEDLLIVGSMVMVAAVPLAFFGDSRFKVPAIPLLIVAGAAGMAVLVGETARDRNRPDRDGAGEPTPTPAGSTN